MLKKIILIKLVLVLVRKTRLGCHIITGYIRQTGTSSISQLHGIFSVSAVRKMGTSSLFFFLRDVRQEIDRQPHFSTF